MVMVIIAGHIDLSVGSVAAFAGIVVAKSMTETGTCPGRWPSCSASASAPLIGAWQGFWVAYVGVPAFIVTLAGMLIFRGGNQFIGNANTSRCPRASGTSAPASCPSSARTPATTTPRCCSACVVASWSSGSELRRPPHQTRDGRRRRRRSGSPSSRLVMLSASSLFAALPVRQRPRRHQLPGLRHHPRASWSSSTRSSPATPSVGRHIYAVGGNCRAAELSGVKSSGSTSSS